MKNKLLLGSITVLTILYWLILLFDINIFQFIPGYLWQFMRFTDKPLGLFWLFIPIVILFYFAVSHILKFPDNRKRNLLILIIMGYLIQMSFGYMEGSGIDGIRQRMITTGHSEFAKIAAVEPDMKRVALNYESLIEYNEDYLFIRTKPPGQLLFYMATSKVANLFSSGDNPAENFHNLTTFAAYLYPLLAYLVIIPLFYVSRYFLRGGLAYLPCIIYLALPSVTLVTLHLDQVIYPILFISGLFLVLHGCKKDNFYLNILSGSFIYFALYFSFSLLPIIPIGFLFGIIYIYSNTEPDLKQRLYGRFIIGFIAGWVLTQFIFWLFLNYNIFIRYENAMTFHQSWKNWDNSFSNIVLFGFLNYIEFLCWIGLPVGILFLAGSRQKLSELLKGQLDFQNLTLAVVVLVFLLLGIFGKTKSEVGRLWIFMMPAVLIFVAMEIQKRFKEKTNSVLWFILALQMISIMFIKRFQDFW